MEDERSINDHIMVMKAEMAKAKGGNMTIIVERMKRTFHHRRQMIDAGATLEEVLETFPALKSDNHVSIHHTVTLVNGLGLSSVQQSSAYKFFHCVNCVSKATANANY